MVKHWTKHCNIFHVHIQSQRGYVLAEDQTESRVICLHKHVPKSLVSFTGAYELACNTYSGLVIKTIHCRCFIHIFSD